MLIFNELQLKPKAEIQKIKDGIVLSDEEEIVFDMAVRGKSAQEIAMKINRCERTVFYWESRLKKKILNYYQYQDKSKVFEKNLETINV